MKYSLNKANHKTTPGMRSLFTYFTKKTVQTSTTENALKIKQKRMRKRKQDEKNKMCKLALEEKRGEKKLAQGEKLKKKQSQEAKAKKEKTRGMRSLFSFFTKKTVQSSTKKAKDAMTKSTTAKYVEPSSVEHALASQTTSIKNLLGEAMHTTRETCASPAKQTRPSKRQRIDDDVEIVQVQAAPKKIRRNKFFQFEEDRRPAFFGVGKVPSFASCRISARRPLEKDYQVFNYDIDSTEECDCVNGENVSGCDDEPEDADPKENEFVHDGWLCGDNQVDWVQEGDDEESDFDSQDEDKADEILGERDEVDGTIFKPKQKPQTALHKVEVTFRVITSDPGPDSILRKYKAQTL